MHNVLFIDGKLREQDQREALALYAMAARGDPKAIAKRLKDIDE